MIKIPLGRINYIASWILFIAAVVHALAFFIFGYFSNWALHAMVVVLALNVTLKEAVRE
jgi:hypothetical protein